VLLTFVATFDQELEQLDVKTSFLHGDLEEGTYIRQLDGFIVPRKENYVCQLKKCPYGLQ